MYTLLRRRVPGICANFLFNMKTKVKNEEWECYKVI